VRTKTIILGAIAALALVTVSANAGNRATHQAQGTLLSLVAATTAVTKADREVMATAAPAASHAAAIEAVQKPIAAVKPAAPRVAVTAACQDAINTLKALRQAESSEDAAERAAATKPPSATAIEADKAEDAAEKQQWRAALLAARTACLPQPGVACQAAITALQALKANGVEDWRQWSDLRNINWQGQLASVRTAVGSVATACGDRD
jgi:hypothetical protein